MPLSVMANYGVKNSLFFNKFAFAKTAKRTFCVSFFLICLCFSWRAKIYGVKVSELWKPLRAKYAIVN